MIKLPKFKKLTRLGVGTAVAAIIATGVSIGANTSTKAAGDNLVIAFQADVPSWDPSINFPTGQGIYKSVFDAPLAQDDKLDYIPHVLTKWGYADGDPMTMHIEMRDDVYFHNGDHMTMEDIKFSFFDRAQDQEHPIDFAGVWGAFKDFSITSPTTATITFNYPMATVQEWWNFLGSYIVPKKYYMEVGHEEFIKNPIGSGPYKLADYQRGSRIVLEANDNYWGGAPKIKHVTFQIITDEPARVAAVQSGNADVAVSVPIREAIRLDAEDGLTGHITPYTHVYYLQIASKGVMMDDNVRAAMHLAIDKKAISERLFNGKAPPLSLTVPKWSSGSVDDYEYPYDPEKAKEMLAKSGYSADNPVTFSFFTTSGSFANDFDMARAISGMWKKVGIDAVPEVIELSKYYELNNTENQPDAFMYNWDNSTGDPEIFTGYMMHPDLPFGSWRTEEIGEIVRGLFTETDYAKRIQGYKDLNIKVAAESKAIPLLQAVNTVVHKDSVSFAPIPQGWVMPYFMDKK
jgi:peptide/nickel transport system substrate-binding protein